MIYIMSYPTDEHGDSLFDMKQLQHFYSSMKLILK